MKVDVLRMLWPASRGGCQVSNAHEMPGVDLLSWPVCLLLLAWCFDASTVRADEPPEFVRDVLPVLQTRCVKCHGAQKQHGQLRLDSWDGLLRGGITGAVLTPGRSDTSTLFRRLTGADGAARMPFEERPLTAAQTALIGRWITRGAVSNARLTGPPETRPHWAYVAPVRTPLPTGATPGDARSPVDSWVRHRLEAERMVAAPEAMPARLLRRVFLDLTGLPPSIAEADAFRSSLRPDAFERVVDHLLASPRYGEKWARSWLDLARYADSNGYQADQFRSVWPYRDWVINALNADMPFDQFSLQQLAGDLLPNPTIDQQLATGFHRLTTCNVEAGVDPEENRVNQIIDRVNTTATVWLGSTIACSQCHDHKYDPFSQREYYQLFAYFNNTPLEVKGDGIQFDFVGPKLSLPLSAQVAALRADYQDQLAQSQQRVKACRRDLLAGFDSWEVQQSKLLAMQPQFHLLQVESFTSQGGASHTLLADGSVLVGGTRPPVDVYTVTARTELTGIRGFRLLALTDPSLPGQGPGRHHPERPNFVLHEFAISAAACRDQATATSIVLHSAQADFSQANYPVAGAVDGNPKTGWAIAPQFGKPHRATFLTRNAVGDAHGTLLKFVMDQHHGASRTIGRFQLFAMTGDPATLQLPAEVITILSGDRQTRTKAQQERLESYYLSQDPMLTKLKQRQNSIQQQLDKIQADSTLVMVEQETPRPTRILRRGNFLDPGAEVAAGTPRALHAMGSGLPANRLGLARWLASSENPLTARVTVNRWWAEIFGRGLVETSEDFGSQGEAPTHPELLDLLAREFVLGGWSTKRLHRWIVSSATYRQQSRLSVELLQRDPRNIWLARAPRFRLPAELIRDQALSIAGLLANNMGGPAVYPPQPDGIWRHVGRNAPKYKTSSGANRFRRGVYVVWRRSAPYPSFTSFDAPDRTSCTVRRSVTNTPLQALTLLNDPAYTEIALALAKRIVREAASGPLEKQLEYGFRLCLTRLPRQRERTYLAELFRTQRERFVTEPDRARDLLGNRDLSQAAAAELAAWFYVASVLLNLDEVITKG
ncbi:MAG: PSD1 and planctomycete cytochrome C domain-containing protein [Planctomycetota bacterium]|nr:PSD1 and planctomycete cytochrome C domain-containing protein [Planctomycetota bacterium]